MKTRTIKKYNATKNGKVFIGQRDDCPVAESKQDAIELLTSGIFTFGDCNSGYAVRIQREIAGNETKEHREAKALGFDDADDMELQMGTRSALDVVEMARQAKLTKAQNIE